MWARRPGCAWRRANCRVLGSGAALLRWVPHGGRCRKGRTRRPRRRLSDLRETRCSTDAGAAPSKRACDPSGPDPAHRHHGQPPDARSAWSWRGCVAGHRQRLAAGRSAAAGAHRGPRRPRRGGGQGVRHRLAAGAFFDSVIDRVSDALLLGGVAWYLASTQPGRVAVLPLAVLAASMLISYERAKAESLGFDARGGLMERAERLIVLAFGLLFESLLVPVLWVMLVLTLVTAVQRFVKVWRQASAPQVQPLAVRWRARRVARSTQRTWRRQAMATAAAAERDAATGADAGPSDPPCPDGPGHPRVSGAARRSPRSCRAGDRRPRAGRRRLGGLRPGATSARWSSATSAGWTPPGGRGGCAGGCSEVSASYGRYYGESFRLPSIAPQRARRRHDPRGVRARRRSRRQGHRPPAVPAAPRELGVVRLLAHAGPEAAGHGRRRAHRAAGAVRLVRRVPRAHRHADRAARPRGRPGDRRPVKRATSSPCCAIATSGGAASRSRSSASGRRCPRVPPSWPCGRGRRCSRRRRTTRAGDHHGVIRPPADPGRPAGLVPRGRGPHHPGAGRRARDPDPAGARAMAPDAAELAERSGRLPRRSACRGASPAPGGSRPGSTLTPCASGSSAPTASRSRRCPGAGAGPRPHAARAGWSTPGCSPRATARRPTPA